MSVKAYVLEIFIPFLV